MPFVPLSPSRFSVGAMTNSGGRDRFFSNDGEYLDCFPCRWEAVQGCTCIDGLCTETRWANPSSDDAWEHRVGKRTHCSSCQVRRRRGEKDCCLYGKCCFFDCLRQVRKQLDGAWSPCFSYILDCVLKLKDVEDAAAVARKEAQRHSYTTLTDSYGKSLQTRGKWSDIGSESDCGTTYILFGSVIDVHNMKVVQSSQAVTRTHFLEVLSNREGGTMCFHIHGREVMCLYLLHVSSSSLSNRYLLQSSCLQMPNYCDEAILSSAFLDIKCCSLQHYPKGNSIQHLKGILKDDCSYQHMRVSKRSNDGYSAEFCRPKKKAFIARFNVASKVDDSIGALIIDKEEKEGFPQHSQSNTQLWWTKCKDSSEHILTKQKEDPLVFDNNNGSTSVDVTHHESLESYGKSNKKLQHGLDTQKCKSKSQYLFDVVEKIQQTSDLGATRWEDSESSKRTAKKQQDPCRSAIWEKGEPSILDDYSTTFSNCIPESCFVADNFPNQWRKATSVEDVEKMHILDLTCQDSLKLNEVSTKNQLPFYHGSVQNISDPLLLDEDYIGFLNEIMSDGRHASNFTCKQKEPSDLVQKDQTMSSVEMTQQDNSNVNVGTAKTQIGVNFLDNNEAKLMDDQYTSSVGHIQDHRSSHKPIYRNLKNRKSYAWKYEKDNLNFSDCLGEEGLLSSDNKPQLDTSQCAAQNGVECSLVDGDYEEFLKRLHINGSSNTRTYENQLDEDMSDSISDEYDIFLSDKWDQNKKMKQEDGHVGNNEQALANNKFVKDCKSPAGIKARKDVQKDKDYEEFLRNFRKRGRSYVLEVTDTEKRNLVVYRYEKYEDKGILPQNIGSRKYTVMLSDVKRAGSDPSNDLSSDEKHLDCPLKIRRRSPRLMQFTERKINSTNLSDSNTLANSPQYMASSLDPSDNEAPGNFNYSFDCGRLDSFSERLHALLGKPYDRKEHKELIEEANRHKPITRERNLRGHSKTYFTQKLGLSYMDHYPDLHERVGLADDGQQLKLLRGFFFWLQNSCREDSFMPWLSSTSKREVVHIDE